MELRVCDDKLYIRLKVLRNKNVRTVLANRVKNLPFLIG
jgi:hypothetical protein